MKRALRTAGLAIPCALAASAAHGQAGIDPASGSGPGVTISDDAVAKRLEAVRAGDARLVAARADLVECEEGCLTPTEAVALAYKAGDGGKQSGRFLLDIEGGGQSVAGNLNRLFFVSSNADYAEFGTLTVAFEANVLNALLRRARSCGGTVEDGRITVQGCRQKGLSDVNIFTMMQRLLRRRIVVEGDVRLQWIDWRFGSQKPQKNRRGEREKGYYQPWVWVTDADQITFVYDD